MVPEQPEPGNVIVSGNHADLVGARNIRDLYLGTISVPHAKVQNVKV